MALARRHLLKPLREPDYDFGDVPYYVEAESVIQRLENRKVWLNMLPELSQLCNEATLRHTYRRRNKIKKQREEENNQSEGNQPDLPAFPGKALSLEYMADRLDLDDPLTGYCVRDKHTGWLKGFITISTFTTWQKWFKWDSLSDAAGIFLFEEPGKGSDSLQELGYPVMDKEDPHSRWWEDRPVDAFGVLSDLLGKEIRDGDPDDQGVIWPRIAEISLLGSLGCGGVLVDRVIHDLESASSPYKFLVLQATENAVQFYEKKGFRRVGAVARYKRKGDTPPPAIPSSRRQAQGLTGTSSAYMDYEVSQAASLEDLSTSLGISADMLLFFNARQFPKLSISSVLQAGTFIRVPILADISDDQIEHENFPKCIETRPLVQCEHKKGKMSESGMWYCSKEGDTLGVVAKKLGLGAKLLLARNKNRFPGLSVGARLVPGTILRLPRQPNSGNEFFSEILEKDKWGWIDESIEENLTEEMCYRHWSFSDDPIDFTHASYMMALKLNKRSHRQNGTRKPPKKNEKLSNLTEINSNLTPVAWNYRSFKVPHNVFLNPKPSLPPPPKLISKIKQEIYEKEVKTFEINQQNVLTSRTRKRTLPASPQKTSSVSFKEEKVEEIIKTADLVIKLPKKNVQYRHVKVKLVCKGLNRQKIDSPLMKALANGVPFNVKVKHMPIRTPLFALIEKSMYFPPTPKSSVARKLRSDWRDLFNKVVKVRPKHSENDRNMFLQSNASEIHPNFAHILAHHKLQETRQKETDFEYYYVITYIPDVQYLRLAPMKTDAKFDDTNLQLAGFDQWRCVPETEGYEIDVPAHRVESVRAGGTCGTSDADNERWFIDTPETRVLRKLRTTRKRRRRSMLE